MCDALESWDESPDWAARLTEAAQGGYTVGHTLNVVETVKASLARRVPDIAMLDSGTARLAKTADRGVCALLCLAAGVRYVILHDTEVPDPCYGWGPVFRAAQFKLTWPGLWYGKLQPDGRKVPWTSVVSDVDNLAELRHNLRTA
jgi:hypothetical protein